MNNIAQTAAEMMESGFRIFPMLGATDHDGEPLDEKEAFKRPRSSGWQSTPDWSEEQLEVMTVSGQLDTGYGVLCTGFLVIDVDPRNGGGTSIQQLLEDVPEIAGAGMIVETGRRDGGRHYYFKAPEGVALVTHLKGYDGIDAKSNGYVIGPGSMHASGNAYRIVHGSPDDIDEAPSGLIDLLRKPEYHRAVYEGGVMDVTHSDLAEMVSVIPNNEDDYEEWVRIGMAIHDALGGEGYEIWEQWSSKSSKHDDSKMHYKWHSFGKASMPVTIGTLVHMAQANGWVQSVTFEAEPMDEPTLTTTVEEEDLLDISSVDLLRPSGFVGEIKTWIDDQCRYSREHLSVAAALVAVGNVVGLRYTDDLDGVTANMFAFGVADSSSGKEAVLQAMQKIMVETNISAAAHGFQKSQQEVMRNLIRHQAAFYIIDELGIELGKAVNAQKKGGAAYLEGLIGTLMSLFSKADGKALLSGDVKEDVRKAMQAELSQHLKAIENNEDKTGGRQMKADRLQDQLSTLDQGLDKPFISLIGFTTPSTFDSIIDEDQATSGFLGRALLVREHDSNPWPKRPFQKRPMSDQMRNTLRGLFDGGHFNPQNDRVEHIGDRISIQTTPEAAKALDKALDWTINYAEVQKEQTGLEAVVRRGYEMIAKVSLILAAPSKVRTLEHVRWAFALVKRDIEEKLRLVVSNDTSRGADKNLMAKITKYISSDHGETVGVIKNRLRTYKPEDVLKALEQMEKKGAARREATEHPLNGKCTERWFFGG